MDNGEKDAEGPSTSLPYRAQQEASPFALPLLSLPFFYLRLLLRRNRENHKMEETEEQVWMPKFREMVSKSLSQCYVGGKVLRATVKTVLPGPLSPRPPPASLCALPLPILPAICFLLHIPSTSYHPILTPVGPQETSGDVSVEPLKQQCLLLLQGLMATSNF